MVVASGWRSRSKSSLVVICETACLLLSGEMGLPSDTGGARLAVTDVIDGCLSGDPPVEQRHPISCSPAEVTRLVHGPVTTEAGCRRACAGAAGAHRGGG